MKMQQRETGMRAESNKDLPELDNGGEIMPKVNSEAFFPPFSVECHLKFTSISMKQGT